MKHMKKHDRASVGLIADTLDREGIDMGAKPSGENTSGIMTKPLEAVLHQRDCEGMGLSAAHAQPELQSEEEAVMKALLTLRLVDTLDLQSSIPYADLSRGLLSLSCPLATLRSSLGKSPDK